MTKETSSFFDYFSKEYEQKAFKHSLGTQYLSRIEINFVLENLQAKKGDQILDIGAGTGRLACLLANKSGIKYYGIDISRKMMEKAVNKLKTKQVNFVLTDAGKKLPFRDNAFNQVICIRVLKYIPLWEKTIKEVARVLQQNGTFIFDIANPNSIAYLGFTHTNCKLLSFSEVEGSLRTAGLQIAKIEAGARFPFLLYKRTRRPNVLSILKRIEETSNKFLPEKVLSRNILIASKKIAK